MQKVRGMRENGATISFAKDSTKLSRGGALRQSAVTGPTYDGSFVVTLSRQATESKGSQKVWDRERRTLRYACKTTKGCQLGPKW